ncbi:hypothetical protein KUTeg_016140 [Tegillarca granosa]|uniref:mRNA export factor n=1 Tax=Tegillarca granosa TaxID=220873 RepID=A0ABQ9EQB2_TEGGR|nr:hypothetical protein KUTeg_016140 [Tegillarca granosa]
MSIFGGSSSSSAASGNFNAMKDIEVRCWEVHQSGQTVPKAQQTHTGPVLTCDWSDHDAAVKTVHWIKAPNYSCLMTGSWDKTLKFWDTRSPNPIDTIQLPERCYCADVVFPMAVVGTANRELLIYQLDNRPQEFSRIESPLKFQHRCVTIFTDKKTNAPTGFALGSIEGRVAIHYVNPTNPKDNFTFKCHRSNGVVNGMQDIFAVNDIAFHPEHGTLATVGSDSRFSFWDKDARTKIKTSEQFDQPLTSCDFNKPRGEVFAYATSYDWSKGHEGYDPQKKPHIFLRSCYDELKPSNKKS